MQNSQSSLIVAGQSSQSDYASSNSLLQSPHLSNKRKVDALLDHDAQDRSQSVRNVRLHVQSPDSCSVFPADHLMPLKPQAASESNTCVDSFFPQVKNPPRKRKCLDLQAANAKDDEVADQHIRHVLKSPRTCHAQGKSLCVMKIILYILSSSAHRLITNVSSQILAMCMP